MDLNASVLWIAGAWVFWGSYPVPFKTGAVQKANVDPFVFQFIKSFFVFATSWLVLLLPNVEFVFTYWGFIGAAIWVPSGLLFITSVKLTGVAFTTPIANGCQVLVSFCWGAFFFHEEVKNWYLSMLALFIMIVGMCGISYSVNYETIKNKRLLLQAIENSKDGADEAQPLVVKDDNSGDIKKKILGMIFAVGVGILGGTMNVPLKHAPPEAHGIQYLTSFGIGAMLITLIVTSIYVSARWMLDMGVPEVHPKVVALPGSSAGLLWAAGNVCNIYSTLEFGQTIGYPLVMCCMMVAGLWGIFYYGEAPNPLMKVLFVFSCTMLICGVTLISLFG